MAHGTYIYLHKERITGLMQQSTVLKGYLQKINQLKVNTAQ